jgi:6-phosphogluconolactonase
MSTSTGEVLHLYVGSYTEAPSPAPAPRGEGISVFSFSERTGALDLVGGVPAINPSYLALNASGTHLYAVQERSLAGGPAVCAYRMDAASSLPVLLNAQPLPDGYPCHLAVSPDGRELAVACYEGGSVCLLPIAEGGHVGAVRQVLRASGSGPHPVRQRGPHAHMVDYLDGDSLLTSDLGTDSLRAYRRDGAAWSLDGVIALPPGSGTRHFARHPDGTHLAVVGELTGVVSLVRRHHGRWELVASVRTLPADHAGSISAAAIRFSPDGGEIYVSHRGGNAIARLDCQADGGNLQLRERIPCAGRCPRDFILSPGGKWLLAVGQDSSTIEVFRREGRGGAWIAQQTFPLGTPVCLVG